MIKGNIVDSPREGKGKPSDFTESNILIAEKEDSLPRERVEKLLRDCLQGENALEHRRLLLHNERLEALLPLLETSDNPGSREDLGKLLRAVLEIAETQHLHLKQLLRQTTQAQENERRRIALEIHDSVAQWMLATSYRIQALGTLISQQNLSLAREEIGGIGKVIDKSLGELRRVIADLYPSDLDELGLIGALRRNLEDLERDTGIACSLQIKGLPPRLPSAVQIAVYRITQEALTNIRKHSLATNVSLRLNFSSKGISVEVRDNGQGFDPSQILHGAQRKGSVGLLGMRDRAESLGGTLEIKSAPGCGTSLALNLALSSDEYPPGGKDAR